MAKRDKFKSVVGKTFNRFTILSEYSKTVNGQRRTFVVCKCECGEIVTLRKDAVISENVKSCGCLYRERDIPQKMRENFIDGSQPQKIGAMTIANKSGVVGVNWDKSRKKWQASIRYQGKKYHLGRFDGIDDAIAARQKAEREVKEKIVDPQPRSWHHMQWDEKMNVFTEYYLEHGLPTTNYNKSVFYKGVNLTTWWATQRKFMKSGTLMQRKIDRFSDIGINMDEYGSSSSEKWTALFDIFATYYNQYGIPTSCLKNPIIIDEVNLSSFWFNSKYAFQHNKLPEWKLKKFISIGISEEELNGSVSKYDLDWYNNYDLVCDYLLSGKTAHKDQGQRLMRWLDYNRKKYDDGNMPDYRRGRFEMLLSLRKK